MKVNYAISVLSLGSLVLADSTTTSSPMSITNAASYLQEYGITSRISGAKATSLANALLSYAEARNTQSDYQSAWSVIQTALPSNVLESIYSSGYTYQLNPSTTVEPSWFSGLPDSVKKELLADESKIASIENPYFATTSSSGLAAQQTVAAGILAAGILGVAAIL